MHLGDGGGGHGRAEFGKKRIQRLAKRLFHTGLRGRHAEGWQPVLKAGEIGGDFRADNVFACRQKLAKLDIARAKRCEGAGQSLAGRVTGKQGGQPERQCEPPQQGEGQPDRQRQGGVRRDERSPVTRQNQPGVRQPDRYSYLFQHRGFLSDTNGAEGICWFLKRDISGPDFPVCAARIIGDR